MIHLNVLPVMALSGLTITLIVVLVVMIAVLLALYIFGNKMQKKQESTQQQLQAGAQNVSLLVIDKKRMKLKEAGFPQLVIDQTPKYLRRSKVPVVKAKIGPKVMSLMCEEKAFEVIPVKKEVKVVMNGIYIMEVKSARGGLEERPAKVGLLKKAQRRFLAKAGSSPKDKKELVKGKKK